MEQLTWLQQSLQKPRLSAVARILAEVFPRQGVPPVIIGESNATRGAYNSASRLAAGHLEYPGHILRYREFSAGGNYISYGWARPYTDHIGILGGQVTVSNDGFFVGVTQSTDQQSLVLISNNNASSARTIYKPLNPSQNQWSDLAINFASLVPSLPGLLTNTGDGPLVDSDGTILLVDALTFEEPLSRGFCSIQWLTESETMR
jgi:hypothetical protein|nr:MAG TPA: hypothetical protein [Caudoviricetes sp.]